MSIYLHEHKEFPNLLNILSEQMGIEAGLIEKDYWIMHVLYGLKSQGYEFELKGGTSLSKGFKFINRFSEDIDIHIRPPKHLGINENPNNCKENNSKKRKEFYDQLAKEINIPGIISIERDTAFDESECYRSGGIRLYYNNSTNIINGLKEGVLLEAGFDNVTPNQAITIGSWAFDWAIKEKVKIIDNRAVDIACYNPAYTLVEKLQTIATKFRIEQQSGIKRANFMRQYYDVYCLLNAQIVQEFIGSEAYLEHKKKRFPTADFSIPIHKNEAFLLSSEEIRSDYAKRYKATEALYYNGQPDFEEILMCISKYLDKL